MSAINGFDFIENKIPAVPELRFSGKTQDEYKKYAEGAKKTLLKILGTDKMQSAPLNVHKNEPETTNGYVLQRCTIDTMPGLTMPFYVLSSDDYNGKAVIALHGHGSEGKEGLAGKASVDCTPNIERFSYTYAFEFADKGYTVFIPDLLGAGERTLGIYDDTTAECNDINNALISLGMSLQGVILYENMRLCEYISSLGFKDISCCGFSGGGQASLWLAVMDERISRAVVSGFLHSYKDTLIYTNRCGCNFVPLMWLYADMGDLLALCAPKDIFIETGKDDNLNGTRGIDGVLEQLEIANKCYRLFDKELKINICDGMHRWYGSCMENF